MPIWNYMAGRRGAHEEYVLGNGRIHMNFNLDRSALFFEDQHDIRDYLIEHKRPDRRTPRKTAEQDAGNLWRFLTDADRGDIVVMRRRPIGSRTVAVAEIIGDYAFAPDLSAGENQPGPHHREVHWIATDVPIGECGLGQDWLSPARLTFARILESEENVERRIRNALDRW